MQGSQRKQSLLKELAGAVKDAMDSRDPKERTRTSIDGLLLSWATRPKQAAKLVLKQPALCITVQGAKWAISGDERFDYGVGKALAVTIATPARSAISIASASEPYLGLILPLDLNEMQRVTQEIFGLNHGANAEKPRSLFVLDLTAELLDCFLRAVRLLQTPAAIPVLYPSLIRELSYWLLCGVERDQFRRMAQMHVQDSRITRVMLHMQQEFRSRLSTSSLTTLAGMSVATFRRKFKEVASTTPLRYQKQLRLLEGRRLMILAGASMQEAAHEVGYESASHFSRDYARAFGKPPTYDASQWKTLQH